MNQYGSTENGRSEWEQSIGNGQMLRDWVAQYAGTDGFGLVLWKDTGSGRTHVGQLSFRTTPKPTQRAWTIHPKTLDGALRSIQDGDTISIVRLECHATSKANKVAAVQAVESIPEIWTRRSAQPTPCAAAL
mgnify:CR=1 FL=1